MSDREQKIKFFAAHLGCEVIHQGDKHTLEGINSNGGCLISYKGTLQSVVDIKVLELYTYPLETIEQMHLEELGSKVAPISLNPMYTRLLGLQVMYHLFGIGEKQRQLQIIDYSNIMNMQTDTVVSIYDYLRSKSYRLPWMGITTGEQVHRGYVFQLETAVG